MTPVRGFPFSGDQKKAKVELRLSGLTKGEYYVLGDQLEGELQITPLHDMELRCIVCRLDFIIEGKHDIETIRTETRYVEAPKVLKGGRLKKVPISVPYRFSRPGYKGGQLVSYWRLNVFLDYDPSQYDRSMSDRVSNVFTSEKRHGTSFEIWVRYGRGAYRTTPQNLPIGLLDLSLFTKATFLIPFVFALWFLGSGLSGINGEDWHVLAILAIVVVIGWLFIRLNTFQLTPMEIQPLRDGQLRLRILDRGNNRFQKATVGYRLLECYVDKNHNDDVENLEEVTRFKKAFNFEEVSRREEHLYEAILPWPIIDLPTSGTSGNLGYKWEVFLCVPNPISGKVHEKSWPIEVGWEQLRLTPPTTAELEQEELEVLKLKELERLPRHL